MNELWYLDLETEQWFVPEVQGQTPERRFKHTATHRGSLLIIFGGENQNNELLNDLWVYSTDKQQWEEIIPSSSDIPTIRSEAGMTSVGSKLYIYGGRLTSVRTSSYQIRAPQTSSGSTTL